MDPAVWALVLGFAAFLLYSIFTRRNQHRFVNKKSVDERDALAQQLIEEESRRKVGFGVYFALEGGGKGSVSRCPQDPDGPPIHSTRLTAPSRSYSVSSAETAQGKAQERGVSRETDLFGPGRATRPGL